VIGKKNIIREFVTIHRAVGEGNLTKVGDNNFIMANAHIAHNCKINNNIVITNFAGLTGHVEIEDYSTISGLVAIHQFVRIGRLAMVGGASKVVKDVPPYLLANGHPAQVYGLNFVGLRRHNIKNEKISILKEAFRIIYKSGLTISKALQRLETLPQIEEIQHLINFIKQSKRGICRGSAKISSQLLPATEI
jgi:UDP-N-acetylglucosamine acyltransferase